MLNGYTINNSGVIQQLNPSPYVYDHKYVEDRYDSYGIQCDMMSYLRYGYMVGVLEHRPRRVLDIGYGNGSFLKICRNAGMETYGYDVSEYPLEYGTKLTYSEMMGMEFDVITFFDSLEHFSDLGFLEELQTQYIVVSVPECQYNHLSTTEGEVVADEYFAGWKHRRPDEHIWHFDSISLCNTFERARYHNMSLSNIEDIIRKPTSGYANILSAVFNRMD